MLTCDRDKIFAYIKKHLAEINERSRLVSENQDLEESIGLIIALGTAAGKCIDTIRRIDPGLLEQIRQLSHEFEDSLVDEALEAVNIPEDFEISDSN